MRLTALQDTLRAQLTPRRKRQGLLLLGLFLAWSLLGLLLLPSVIESQARRFVRDTLGLELTVTDLRFNPWMLSVRINGLTVREPGAGGEVLLAFDQLYVNAQLWSSLWWRGASLAALELERPMVNVRIRQDGSLNLLQLVPPEDPQDSGEARWRIGRLAVRQGHIAFHDDTRPTPFATAFSPLNLELSDLTSNPDRDGLYNLRAETGDGEVLDWRGTLAMQPVRSEGELRITGLRATTPWRYLQDQLPVVVSDGSIAISGHYRLKVDNGVSFTLDQGRVSVSQLAVDLRGEAPLGLRLDRLELTGARFAHPSQEAGFDALTLGGLAVSAPDAAAPLAQLDRLEFADARHAPAGGRVSLARIGLRQLRLADGDAAPLLALPELDLQDLALGLDQRTAHVARIGLGEGEISLRRESDGRLNWDRRLSDLAARVERGLVLPPAPDTATTAPVAVAVASPPPAPRTKGKAPPAEPGWTPTLGELDLKGFTVAVEDRVPATAVATRLENIQLRLLPRQAAGQPHRLEGSLAVGSGGRLALEGRFSEQPLTVEADVELADLRLPTFAPYFTDLARFALEDGALDVAGHVSVRQGARTDAGFRGRIAVRNFAANDLDLDERFLAWRQLAASGVDWRLAPGRLVIREVIADRPFMRLIVGADKTLNLSHVIVSAPGEPAPAAAAAPTPATAAAAPYPLRVDRIRLQRGAMLFADMTLKPQFATGIQDLDGEVTGISSAAGSRATANLKGRVDQFGRAVITGTLEPLASDRHTDLNVRFTDLELTTMTPYSAKFAGYRIDKGKLSLDLGYRIRDRRLEATNKIVFNQLTLGDKVDSPDAMNLPLKLAVAILKDKDGVIDVDLPLTGSLDDPEFRIAPLVWKAFVNLLAKAATAPFSLIAGLVGGGEDMDSIAFTAGGATLEPAQADKLGKLAAALAQRPALGVEVRGAYDPVADARSLRERRFEAAWQKRLAEGGKPRKLLEGLFVARLGEEALARQRALSLKPAGEGDLAMAEAAYLAALRDELVARETILEGDLRQLALERARVLRAQLVEASGVDAARIFVLEPVTTPATDGKVILRVTLAAN